MGLIRYGFLQCTEGALEFAISSRKLLDAVVKFFGIRKDESVTLAWSKGAYRLPISERGKGAKRNAGYRPDR